LSRGSISGLYVTASWVSFSSFIFIVLRVLQPSCSTHTSNYTYKTNRCFTSGKQMYSDMDCYYELASKSTEPCNQVRPIRSSVAGSVVRCCLFCLSFKTCVSSALLLIMPFCRFQSLLHLFWSSHLRHNPGNRHH